MRSLINGNKLALLKGFSESEQNVVCFLTGCLSGIACARLLAGQIVDNNQPQ